MRAVNGTTVTDAGTVAPPADVLASPPGGVERHLGPAGVALASWSPSEAGPIQRLPQFARFVGGKVRAMVAPDGHPSSDHPRYLELILEARTENIPAIRRALERLDMPTALLDDAKLLATELLTNSIRHSGLRPDEVIHLTAQWSGTTLRITVRDRARSAEPPPVVGSIRPSIRGDVRHGIKSARCAERSSGCYPRGGRLAVLLLGRTDSARPQIWRSLV